MNERGQRRPGEVAVLVVDRLDARAVHGQQLAAEQIELPAEQHKGAEHRPEGHTVVTAEVSDGLEVGLEASEQPDHLDVAVRLSLEAPARTHPVQVSVDVELQQVGGVVARPTRRLRHDAGEAGGRQVQFVHEGLNEADRVVGAHIVVHRLGQEQKLRAVMSRKMCHGRDYHADPLTRQKNQPSSHTVCMVYAALFLSAFASATVLPGSFEAVLVALLTMGQGDPAALLAVATAGNVLSSVSIWALGLFCAGLRDRPWFPVIADVYDRAVGWFHRWGVWSLLLSWVPLTGDGIALVAGLLRVHLLIFLLLTAISKLARYGVLFAAFTWWDG